MTRTERLLKLLDLLRQSRRAVSADAFAEKLAISSRTVYRDIDTLRRQGADIRGEAGVGFVLHKDFLLPPLMFNESEIEALVFGIRWVTKQQDSELAEHALAALAKVNAILPDALAEQLSTHALYPYVNAHYADDEAQTLTCLRQAVRESLTLTFDYCDKNNNPSQRRVFPVALGYFEEARLLVAWCELRQDFRHFRPDRMKNLTVGETYPASRTHLLNQWQRVEGITLQSFDF